MADVLRDLRVRVGVDAAGVQQGMARVRQEVNATSQQLDQFSRAAIQPTLSPDITSQISKWDAADQGRFNAIRGRVGLLYGELGKAQTALDTALASGSVKAIGAADRNIGVIQRSLSAQQLAARNLGVINLEPVAASLGDRAEKIGRSSGERFFTGAEHAAVLAGSRLAGLPIPGRAVVSGLPFIVGLVVVDALAKGFENAAIRAEKLRSGLDALRESTGLSINDTAELAAEAQAAGVDFIALSKAVDALSGTGLTFAQAQAQVQGFSDQSLQAAEAQRLFGSAAKDIAPLLLGEAAAAKTSADQLDRLRQIQIGSSVQKALDAAAPKGNLFDFIGGLIADTKQLSDIQSARAAAGTAAFNAEFSQNHNLATAFEASARATAGYEATLTAVAQGQLNVAGAMQQATDRTNELTKSSTTGSTALQGIVTSADALARAMSGADLAIDPLGKKLQNLGSIAPDVASAFDKLTSAGVVGGTTKRALEIALELHLDAASQATVLRDIEGLATLAGQTIDQITNQRLGAELVGGAQSNLDRLIGVRQQEEDIQQRIADIQAGMDDRHKAAVSEIALFNRSDLDKAIQAREEEKSFFAFKNQKDKKSDTARQDAADQREIARLQAQLGTLQKNNPDLDAKIGQARSAVAELQKLVDAWLTALNKVAIPPKIPFPGEPHDVAPGQTSMAQIVDTPPNSRDLGINAAQAAAIADVVLGTAQFADALSTGSLRLADPLQNFVALLSSLPKAKTAPEPHDVAPVDVGITVDQTVTQTIDRVVTPIPDIPSPVQQLIERTTSAIPDVAPTVSQLIERTASAIPELPATVTQTVDRVVAPLPDVAPSLSQEILRTATAIPDVPASLTQAIERTTTAIPDVAPQLEQLVQRTAIGPLDLPAVLVQTIERTVTIADTPPNSRDLGVNASQAAALVNGAAEFSDALSNGTLRLADVLATPQTVAVTQTIHVTSDGTFGTQFDERIEAAIVKAAIDARIIVRSTGGGNRLL